MNNIALGKTLKAMYKLSGKTLTQLSDESGLTLDTINNLVLRAHPEAWPDFRQRAGQHHDRSEYWLDAVICVMKAHAKSDPESGWYVLFLYFQRFTGFFAGAETKEETVMGM